MRNEQTTGSLIPHSSFLSTRMQLAQFSFLIALGLGAILIVAATWSQPRQRWPGIGAALLLLVGWWVLRPGAGGTATADTVQAALASGQPVVVEVYSDY
jgi:hypothetical protein